MFKTIHYTDKDVISELKRLKEKYNLPNKDFDFKPGMHKGKPCVFVLNDPVGKLEYGEPFASRQFPGDVFVPPKNQINIEDFEVKKHQREWKISLNLFCGKTIYIIPATLEPKDLIADLFGVEDDRYGQATEYGRAAYDVSFVMGEEETKKVPENQRMQMDDPRIKKLIVLALVNSYNLPADMWSWMKILSQNDMNNILSVAMGFNPVYIEKKKIGLEVSETSSTPS